MHWQIGLIGDPDHILQAKITLADLELRIVKEGDKFYLESPRFTLTATHSEIALQAARVVDSLNGAQRLANNTQASFALQGGPIRVRDDGTKEHAGFVVGRGVLGVPGVIACVYDREGHLIEPQPPENPVACWLALGLRDSDVADLLRWWGGSEHSWFWLYKVFEVIRADCNNNCDSKNCNGEKIMAQRGWMGLHDSDLFRRTACHPQASGDESRHGHSTVEPPTHPMRIDQARALIKKLLRHWLNHKAQQHIG